jgi:hypothetical protein
VEQDELLSHVVRLLEEQEITYMLVGSLASAVYGEPRLTHDINVVLELRPDQVAPGADSARSARLHGSAGRRVHWKAVVLPGRWIGEASPGRRRRVAGKPR